MSSICIVFVCGLPQNESMTLQKRKKRGLKTVNMTFRFSDDACRRLKVLAELNNESQANVLEDLIEDAFLDAKENDKADLARAERQVSKKT